MGIRFFCPNGHKLNVKEFQAGRRGICPFCGVSVQIPLESTRPSGREKREVSTRLATERGPSPPESGEYTPQQIPNPAFVTPEDEELPTVDYAAPMASPSPVPAAEPSPVQTAPQTSNSPVLSQPEASSQQQPVTPSPTAGASMVAPSPLSTPAPPPSPPPPASSAPADPLDEAPEAVWYVRPESGGQFGPATADVMRNWIVDGRVVAKSMVWREGWADWTEAGTAFPQLAASEEMAALTEIGSDVVSPIPTPVAGLPPPVRRRSSAMGVTAIVLLLLAVMVLIGVLFYVLGGTL